MPSPPQAAKWSSDAASSSSSLDDAGIATPSASSTARTSLSLSPLHDAAARGDLPALRAALRSATADDAESGISIDARDATNGQTALMAACGASSGASAAARAAVIGALMDAGADADARERSPRGWVAAHVAAAAGRDDAIALLVARGADPNCRARAADDDEHDHTAARNDDDVAWRGDTPLHVALTPGGNLPQLRVAAVVRALAAAPAPRGIAPLSLELRDARGRPPLIAATLAGNLGAVRALLDHGAVVTVTSHRSG